jgi:hypothetical protein
VANVLDVPLANWESLGLFEAKQLGVAALPRPFLSDWLAFSDCSAWRAARRDEFAMEDKRQTIRQLLNDRPPITRVRVALTMPLAEYDFDRQGYPMSVPTSSMSFQINVGSSCAGFYPGQAAGGIPQIYNLAVASAPDWPPFLALPRDKAQEISRSIPASREILVDYVVDLVSIGRGAIVGTTPDTISVEPVAAFVWTSRARSHLIGAIGNYIATNPTVDEHAPPNVGKVTGTVSSWSPDGWPVINGQAIPLNGVDGIARSMRKGLAAWVSHLGNSLICTSSTDGTFQCLTPQGVDVALGAIFNGAGRATADASQAYHDAELKAQAAHRGIWH